MMEAGRPAAVVAAAEVVVGNAGGCAVVATIKKRIRLLPDTLFY